MKFEDPFYRFWRKHTMNINEHVHPWVSTGFGSNVYLLTDEIIALIDTGITNNTEKVFQFCRNQGVSPETLDLILLTHAHIDHIMGLYHILEISQAQLACHKAAAPALETPNLQRTLISWFTFTPPPLKVDRKLRDGDLIELGSLTLHVIHTPGHTPGSICFYEPTFKILFTGDTIFAGGGIGRSDLPGGDGQQLVQSIEKLLKLKVNYLFPGHNRIVTENAEAAIRASYENAKLGFL
ncbi:MAG: MBL fold metallo-hydrolase [Candidatus Heimdallarchaeota archaeon]